MARDSHLPKGTQFVIPKTSLNTREDGTPFKNVQEKLSHYVALTGVDPMMFMLNIIANNKDSLNLEQGEDVPLKLRALLAMEVAKYLYPTVKSTELNDKPDESNERKTNVAHLILEQVNESIRARQRGEKPPAMKSITELLQEAN